MLMVHFGLSGVNIENAISLPSGDQRASATRSDARVIWLGEPSTSIQRTKICGRPSASARYSTRLPSGAQRAFEPLAKKRFCEPSAFMIQREGSHLSSSRLAWLRT
jgi:hypothetical protein